MEYSECMFNFGEGIECEIKKDVPMKMYTSFKTGGNAEIMLTPKDEKSLYEALKKCKELEIKPFILAQLLTVQESMPTTYTICCLPRKCILSLTVLIIQ